MKIQRIDSALKFKSQSTEKEKQPNRELIDVLMDKVKNPRDVNDCVAVPRGIFKAYISLMAGTGLMAISNLLPKKAQKPINLVGWGLNILSAYFFAKPFAFKGLSPTVTKAEVDEANKNTQRG